MTQSLLPPRTGGYVLPVAIRCQAVDGAGENLHRLATGGYVLATGGYGLPVAIRCQAVDGAGENLHRLATGGYRLPVAIRPELAESLGRSAVEAIELGHYLTDDGKVEWSQAVRAALELKVSIAQETELPLGGSSTFAETIVQVSNETTLGASKRLVDEGKRPLALNFANGSETGGGFLRGATAQEEALCRSSALYATLVDDPMYDFHRNRELWSESSGWAILSPNVPVFRNDSGMERNKPWLLSFITCAAPYTPCVGQPRSNDLLRGRVQRCFP